MKIWIELYKSGLDSTVAYTNEKSAQISFLYMLLMLLHFYNMAPIVRHEAEQSTLS